MRDSISFWTDLPWSAIKNFVSTLFCEIWIIEKEKECFDFFNRSSCKFSILDRGSLFSDRDVIYDKIFEDQFGRSWLSCLNKNKNYNVS